MNRIFRYFTLNFKHQSLNPLVIRWEFNKYLFKLPTDLKKNYLNPSGISREFPTDY